MRRDCITNKVWHLWTIWTMNLTKQKNAKINRNTVWITQGQRNSDTLINTLAYWTMCNKTMVLNKIYDNIDGKSITLAIDINFITVYILQHTYIHTRQDKLNMWIQ